MTTAMRERTETSAQVEVAQTLQTTETKPAFHIDSDGAADWLLKTLAALDAEADLLKAQYLQAKKRVESDVTRLTELYGLELEAYVAQRVADDKRGRKSLILPHGTCGFRTVPAAVRLDKTYGGTYPEEFIELVPQLLMAPYLMHAEELLERTGEALPGIEVVAARESFSIRFGKSAE